MEAFGENLYTRTFYACTSPYCVAVRPRHSNCTVASTVGCTSSGTSTLSSFSISSILSRNDEHAKKVEEQASDSNSSPKIDSPTGSNSTFYPPQMSLERFHPYPHRTLATLSAFSRVGHCSLPDLGKNLINYTDPTFLSNII